MSRIHNATLIAASVLVVSMASASRWLYVRWLYVRTEERQSPDKLTRSEIIQRAQRLLPLLAPRAQFRFIESDQMEMYDRLHRPLNVWLAQCSYGRCVDGTVPPYALLRWNASTGRLISFSREIGTEQTSSFRLNARQAEQYGINWLNLLDSNEKDRQWHRTGRFERNQFAWLVHYTAGSNRATVAVDAHDGSLQSARIW